MGTDRCYYRDRETNARQMHSEYGKPTDNGPLNPVHKAGIIKSLISRVRPSDTLK